MFFRRRRRTAEVRRGTRTPLEQVRMLEGYVRTKSAILSESPPTMEQPIFSSGLLDSLDFAELLGFISDTFDVDLWSRGDVGPEEVDTLEAMVSLIQQEQQMAATC